MVLGDLGATVTRVDPPGGPRWRHNANAVLQRGKRSIVLDLKSSADANVARSLIADADVVIEGFRPGVMQRLSLGPQESIERHEHLIYCSLPGFAHDDPRASLPAWEGIVNAAAGVFVQLPDADAPAYNALPVASSYGAAVGAHTVLAALIARERSGRGQWIEIPLFDAAFEAIGNQGQYTPVADPIPYKPTRVMPPPLGHYRCADGRWLHLCLIQDRHLEWFGREFLPAEWIEDGMTDPVRLWTDPELIVRARERFAELFATRSALEWERAINEQSGAPSALCATSEQWLREDDHARAIGAVIGVDDPVLGHTFQAGYPVVLSETPPHVAGPRHELDEDRATVLAELASNDARPPATPAEPGLDQALAGIRVVDLTQVLAGPTSTRILAEYGAEVVKIQSAADNQHRYHFYGNSGKRSIILDLKTPKGREILARFVEGVDIFVENFARGVAERLGVGEDDIRRASPEVIYGSISAYGRAGFRGGYRGREELGQAITGMQVRWGGYGGEDEPLQGPLTFTDSGAGLYAALALLVGLYHRLRTGKGQRIESSLAHAATFEQVPYMIAYEGSTWEEPNGLNATGWGPLDRIYRAADRWLYLAALGGGDREAMAKVEGLEGLSLENDAALEADLQERLRDLPAAVWVQRLNDEGIGAHVVLEIDEVMEDPAVKARGLSVVREHPLIGPIRNPGPSERLSVTPARLTFAAGPPGYDSSTLLEEVGFGDERNDLIARGIVRTGVTDDVDLFGRPR